MFLLTDRPHIFPGRTLLGDTRGPVVDTGVEMDLGGRVYLNRQEAWEVARLFGFVEAETHEAAVARAALAEVELAEARDALADQQEQLDAVGRTLRLVEPVGIEPFEAA